MSFVLDRSCRQYLNCIKLFPLSLFSIYIEIDLSIFLFSVVFNFFWSTIPTWMMKIPWGFCDNDRKKKEMKGIKHCWEEEKKKCVKRKCLSIDALYSQSVDDDDDHWLEVHTYHTCSLSKRNKTKNQSFLRSTNWKTKRNLFIHRDRWCYVCID